jgi:hypothetical protein
MNKHVKNFTELFENLSSESTDDLIVLAETGIVQWREVVDIAFDRGEMALCYWVQTPDLSMQPIAVFADDRVVYGTRASDAAGVSDASQTVEDAAYREGAKIVMGTSNFRAINYDGGERSVTLPGYSTDRVRALAKATMKKLGRPAV